MNELTTQTDNKPLDLSPRTFEQALTFSNYLAESDLVPKDFKGRPGNCLIAMQWGAEIGLKPLQALQNLAIINGRPALWGDAVIALVRGSQACEYVVEENDGHTATCKVKRRGEAEQVRTFSVDDAKKAGLLGKQGPWTTYPKRMLQMRARAFALRDVFPDILRGLPVAEEVMDIPAKEMGPAQVVEPAEPAALPPCDEGQFEKTLAQFGKAIAAGKCGSWGDALERMRTRYTLTPEQEARFTQAGAATSEPAPAIQDVEPKLTFAQIADMINGAHNTTELAKTEELLAAFEPGEQRAELVDIYEQRWNEVAQ